MDEELDAHVSFLRGNLLAALELDDAPAELAYAVPSSPHQPPKRGEQTRYEVVTARQAYDGILPPATLPPKPTALAATDAFAL